MAPVGSSVRVRSTPHDGRTALTSISRLVRWNRPVGQGRPGTLRVVPGRPAPGRARLAGGVPRLGRSRGGLVTPDALRGPRQLGGARGRAAGPGASLPRRGGVRRGAGVLRNTTAVRP